MPTVSLIEEKLNVRFITRPTLNKLLEAGYMTKEKAQQFQQAALALLVRAVEYAMDKLPLEDARLKHGRFVDMQMRDECGVDNVFYFVGRQGFFTHWVFVFKVKTMIIMITK